jgi:hypothetical protein
LPHARYTIFPFDLIRMLLPPIGGWLPLLPLADSPQHLPYTGAALPLSSCTIEALRDTFTPIYASYETLRDRSRATVLTAGTPHLTALIALHVSLSTGRCIGRDLLRFTGVKSSSAIRPQLLPIRSAGRHLRMPNGEDCGDCCGVHHSPAGHSKARSADTVTLRRCKGASER